MTDNLLLISSAQSMPKLLGSTIDSKSFVEYTQGLFDALPAKTVFRLAILPTPPRGASVGGAGTFQQLPLMLNADRCEILIENRGALTAILRAEYADNTTATANGDKVLEFVKSARSGAGDCEEQFPKFLEKQKASRRS